MVDLEAAGALDVHDGRMGLIVGGAASFRGRWREHGQFVEGWLVLWLWLWRALHSAEPLELAHHVVEQRLVVALGKRIVDVREAEARVVGALEIVKVRLESAWIELVVRVVIVRDVDVARALEVVEVALGVSGVRHVGVDLSITVDAGRVVVGVVDADVVLATVDGARVELVRVGARAVVKRVALVERVWTLCRLVGDGVCVQRGRGLHRVGVTRTLSMHVVFRVVLAAWAALRAVLFGIGLCEGDE